MKKIIIQGFIIVVLFFSTWIILAQVDWVTIFKVQKITDKTEEKLGELFLDIFKKQGTENNNPFVIRSIDSIVNKICEENWIDSKLIKAHLLDIDEVNAFALPGGHLIIYSGLILTAENQEELSGVVAHEIAHLQLNHVMKKLVKEVGLSMLISMTTGNAGAEILKETAKLLSSSAFDRSFEREADIKAIEYLINANINPEPFANFLYKLSKNENEAIKYLTWISTHPDSKERAGYVLEHIGNKSANYEQIFSEDTWVKLKNSLNESHTLNRN